ncbi:GNAT family N-acetyltransferase [Kribbella sp. NPDC051770]|uniref:GNAT family N-acetyltransferase n=1 Tax=Kribbella sp. NPDC051770 TaxID=3155413 RepID=UPI003413369F
MHIIGTELTAPQLHALLKLRVDVFVVEQQCAYPEIDGRDLLPGTHHLWIEDEHSSPAEPTIQAYLRVLTEPTALRIGRVVTAPDARGRGLAAQLMKNALEIVGDADSVLDAQTYVEGFYAKFGYVAEGPEYVEDGIPHRTMWRRLR